MVGLLLLQRTILVALVRTPPVANSSYASPRRTHVAPLQIGARHGWCSFACLSKAIGLKIGTEHTQT